MVNVTVITNLHQTQKEQFALKTDLQAAPVQPTASNGRRNGQNNAKKAKVPPPRKRLTIRNLLRPHVRALALGAIAVFGEAAANLLQPWPLKIVLDDVLRSKEGHGWIMSFIHSMVGSDKLVIVKVACVAVLAIAVLDAVCTYAEKYLATSVAQWISYDLRRTFYAHVQRLSLGFHDNKRTGDLISRVTSDVDDIQSFINSGLLS